MKDRSPKRFIAFAAGLKMPENKVIIKIHLKKMQKKTS